MWRFSKQILKDVQEGVLAIDDFICEKPYSKISDINCYHYSHMKGQCSSYGKKSQKFLIRD